MNSLAKNDSDSRRKARYRASRVRIEIMVKPEIDKRFKSLENMEGKTLPEKFTALVELWEAFNKKERKPIKKKFQPLRQLRKEKGLKQSELAEICYTSPSMVSLWERSERAPILSCQVHLANAFNMPLRDLQEHCGWPTSIKKGAIS